MPSGRLNSGLVPASTEPMYMTIAPMTEATSAVATADVASVMGAMVMYIGSVEAGTNPEFNRPLGMYQHHLELAQAMLLRGGLAEGTVPPSRHIEPLSTAIKAYHDPWIVLQFQNCLLY